jgi:predicted Zn-dependent protease
MLTGSKNWIDAEKHVAKMLKEDPRNTDLKRRQIKILLSLEKYQDAKQIAEEILNKVEGRNEFWVAESLAKALVALKENDSAKKIILLYLAKPEIEEPKMASLKKSLEILLSSATTTK